MIVSLILVLAILAGWALGWVFFLRRRGNRKANIQFGLLLALFSLCVLDNLLVHAGIFYPYQEKYFVPIWYTWSLGPLLFFSIKFTLYPAYEFRFTDAKHFILPLAQASFYWILFASGPNSQEQVWDHFIAPFFKTFEGIGTVILLFTYLALSYRYVKYKQAVARRKGHFWEYSKSIWLQWTLKFLFVLAVVNTSYIVMDFVVYNFLGWNLYSVKGFSYLGDLSFAAMLLWLTGRGAQYVLGVAYPTDKQLNAFYTQNAWTQVDPDDRPFAWFEHDAAHRDPELHLRRLAFLCRLSSRQVRKLFREKTGMDFENFCLNKRLESYQAALGDPRFRNQPPKAIGLQMGFFSHASLLKALKKG
ncbi:MAG: hypothetical protein H6563_04030 [Lewinellaceae bacterium]|nr:hypothetical protein [Lewinellaceae bacterium]